MQSRLVSVLDTVLGQAPALDLFFSATKALDSRITFTRGSTGTFINSSGLVESAASGVARFTHDPVTLASLGLLVEESRTNLFQRSEEFNDAYWTKTRCSISANATTAPDGATTADKLVEDTSTNSHEMFRGISVTSGQAYTFSFYIKQAGRSRVSLELPFNFPAGAQAVFDVSTGTVVSTGAAATASISAQANGFYRCVLTATASATATGTLYAKLVNTGTTTSYTGDGTSGLFLWGAQVEAGAFATSYIPTTSATVTRAADVATMTGTNFSSWFSDTRGTLVADGILGATSGSRRTFTFGGINLGVGTRVNGSASSIIWRTPTNYDASTGTVSAGAIKQAFSYEPSLLSGVVNGGTIVTNTPPSSLPALAAYIGASETGFDYWNGTIARIRYYRRRLPNANLQTLTT